MKPLPPQFDTSHIAETTDQQVLEEFGMTQLLSLIKHYRDTDFDASQMHLTDAEVNAIAKLFIQELTRSVNGKLIAGALNALRHGEEMEEIGEQGEQRKQGENICNRPLSTPTPRYHEGDRVQWKTANPDWGVIVGRFYDYNHHHNQWTICYLIQLASDSPSSAWITTDVATEENLEKIPDTIEPNEKNGNSYIYPTHSRRAIAPSFLHSPTGRYNTGHRHHLRPINQREKYIIDLYSYCELGMTPKQFYAKWDVTYEQLSHICSRSLGTVQCWFNQGKRHYPPQPVDLRHLAIMDFLLDHFEEIPPSLINLLCSS
jgi:hypothetical protein